MQDFLAKNAPKSLSPRPLWGSYSAGGALRGPTSKGRRQGMKGSEGRDCPLLKT